MGNLASNFPCLLESQAPISGKIPHYELSWKKGNSQSLSLFIEAESQGISSIHSLAELKSGK